MSRARPLFFGTIAPLVALGTFVFLLNERGSPPEARGTASLMFQAYPEYSEGGYADRRTVLQGDRITFFIGNSLRRFHARVLRMLPNREPETVLELQGLRGSAPEFACTAEDGCDWKPTYELEVPDHWSSGWYRLEFPVERADGPRHIDFIVAEREPAASVLFVFDVQTAMAYNVYGGASFYGGFDSQGRWSEALVADRLSLRRPVVRSHTYGDASRISEPVWMPHEEEAFREWLDGTFEVAYVSNDALEQLGLPYVRRYPLLVIAGTQEYWSNRQVELLESFVRQGGNLYLSAIEFAYGAIRFEEEGGTVRYFLDPTDDPMRAISPDEVSTQRGAVSNLEDFFGVSLSHGKGLAPRADFSPLRAIVSNHWAFEGTNIRRRHVLTGVRGVGVGAWVERREDGRYCIVSARIPCENVELLAIASHDPVNIPAQRWRDRRADGVVDHTISTLPTETNALVALIHQGRGTMFVGPGGWWNSPHPNDWDPRIRQVIENVFVRLARR